MALPSPDHLHSLHFNALVRTSVAISARFSTGQGQVAQLVEHAAENRGVGSSILPLATGRRSVHDLAAADLGPARQYTLVDVGRLAVLVAFERVERLAEVRGAVIVVQLIPRHEVAELAVVELDHRPGVEEGHPLVEVEEEFADRTEVRSAKHRDRVLGASHGATRRGAVPHPHAAVLVLADPTLVISEQCEPTDRNMPRTLMDERGGMRVAAPMTRELPASAPGFLLRDDRVPQLHRLRAAEREHRLEDPQPQPLGRDVGPTVDHPNLRVLAVRRGQEAEPVRGHSVGVPARARSPIRPLDQVPLPVELLVALEGIERLEYTEIGGGDHSAPESSELTFPYPLGIYGKELHACPTYPSMGPGPSPCASSRPTGPRSATPTSGCLRRSSGSCCGGWSSPGVW